MTRLTALVTILVAAGALAGEPVTMSDGGIQFAVNTALFSLGSTDTLLLEVYQELDIAQLARDNRNMSAYTTEIALESAEGDTIAWDIWNTDIAWSSGGAAVSCNMLPVLQGNWTLTVTITDRANGRQGVAVREMQVDDPGHFSDIEMARTIMPAEPGSSSSLLKGSLIVYPAASTRFTVPGESMMYTYQEIYSLGGSSLLRQSRILNAEGVPVFGRPAETVEIPQGVETVAVVDSFDLSVLREPGLYSLSVIYTQGGDTLYSVKDRMFVQVAETAAESVPETAGITERMLDELAVLLTQEESELYSRLDEQGKVLYYDNYWGSRPGEHQAFLDRCRVVAARYAAFGKEGWQSDRGRVYLKYGEPDEVESNPFSTSQAPYEIWHIYSGTQESFVFADLMGNGDYLQIFSTVAGEVSYSNWQSMLQNVDRTGGSGSSNSSGEF